MYLKAGRHGFRAICLCRLSALTMIELGWSIRSEIAELYRYYVLGVYVISQVHEYEAKHAKSVGGHKRQASGDVWMCWRL